MQHAWIAALANGENVKAIKFDAPIGSLLSAVDEFPGAQRSVGTAIHDLRAANRREFADALADLADIMGKHTRAAMMPEDAPGLMPTLVRLFGAGTKEVGFKLKDLIAYVRRALKSDPRFRTSWNKISDATLRKVAMQAVDEHQSQPADGQAGFFSEPAASNSVQDDLLMSAPKKKREADPYPAGYSKSDLASNPDNFKPPKPSEFMPDDLLRRVDEYVAKYFTIHPEVSIDPETRTKGEALLSPLMKLAEEAKGDYGARICGGAGRHPQAALPRRADSCGILCRLQAAA